MGIYVATEADEAIIAKLQEDAMQRLEASAGAEFVTAEKLTTDEDLAALRGYPAFEELVKRLQTQEEDASTSADATSADAERSEQGN